MNDLQKVLLYQRGKVRYGTAGTTTQTTLASSGGLLINIDSATGDIARTTTGFIEDEKYNNYFEISAGTLSSEFDTAVLRTGTKTVKLSTTNAAGIGGINSYGLYGAGAASMQKYLIPGKASTKYKLSCWVKTTNAASNSVYVQANEFTSAFVAGTATPSNKLTGTNDWTFCTVTFTTAGTCAYLGFRLMNAVSGNISDAWFDINSMTLEEVVEPVANSLTSSSPSLVSFTAVGSTNNIDQSLDPTGAAALTYIPPVAISETATNRQTFVPTKSKVTRIGVWVVTKGTGNWILTVHDASNVVQATATIANASLTNGAFNYFTVPSNVTALGSYHFHVTSTVLDGTLKSGVALDMEGASYIENYYKPTTNFKASQNNSTVSISADEDGFLNGSVINLQTGTASFTETFGTFYLLQYTVSGSDLIAEINLPGNTLSASFTSDKTLEYSSDGIAYSSTFPVGVTKVWVKILAYSGFASFSYSIQFSTSGINVLRNYPTNKDIIKQYSTTLGSATTSATYRATKCGFPAIEYWETPATDKSQLTRTSAIGAAGVSRYLAQQFTPTKSELIGITLWKKTGVVTGDPIFQIRTDSGGTTPTTTILASYTMPLATYNAIGVDTEYTVYLPCSLTIGTAYWFNVVGGVANGPAIGSVTPTAYAGLCKYGSDGITFGTTINYDFYFKTLYPTVFETQFLDVDTTATGSTVAFSELGTTYTAVADGASLAITSTTTPNIFVKANITANRLYLSSNDLNASSDKDGSLKQSVIYQIAQ